MKEETKKRLKRGLIRTGKAFVKVGKGVVEINEGITEARLKSKESELKELNLDAKIAKKRKELENSSSSSLGGNSLF